MQWQASTEGHSLSTTALPIEKARKRQRFI